jgi:hypothetical protein
VDNDEKINYKLEVGFPLKYGPRFEEKRNRKTIVMNKIIWLLEKV